MMPRIPATARLLAALAAVLLAPSAVHAQTAQTVSGTVKLEVPVKLTALSPEVGRVRVECRVFGEGVTLASTTTVFYYEQTPLNGAIDATFPVGVPVIVNSYNAGKTATYTCFIKGQRKGTTGWESFSPTATSAAMRVNVTQPDQGTFTW